MPSSPGAHSAKESYSSDKAFRSRLASLPNPSAFSAPEQFVTLYTGQELETPATDVYRLGAIAMQAFTGEPFRAQHSEEIMTTLRRLSHCALLRRARALSVAQGDSDVPNESLGEESELFAEVFGRLVKRKVAVPEVRGLEAWLKACLEHDPARRPPSARASLEVLSQIWTEVQAELLQLRKEEPEVATQQTEETEVSDSSSEAVRLRRERLELEPPPLLKEMTIL